MSDTQPHLQPQDLGPDAAAILSELADGLEEKWTFGGTEGTEFAKVDDVVRQRISELGEHHKVSHKVYPRKDDGQATIGL